MEAEQKLAEALALEIDNAINGGLPPVSVIGAMLTLFGYMLSQCDDPEDVTRKFVEKLPEIVAQASEYAAERDADEQTQLN
jgi:hypothetical protein